MSFYVIRLYVTHNCPQLVDEIVVKLMEHAETVNPRLDVFVWRGKVGGEIRMEHWGEFWSMVWAPVPSFDADGAEFRAIFDSFV